MKTVIYYDLCKYKGKFIRLGVVPLIILVLLFLVSFVIDYQFPEFNYQYMRWPDFLKQLLCVANWNSHLYINVWQIFGLLYPVFLSYMIAYGLAESIVQEKQSETIVYLHNHGISRGKIMLGKGLLWLFAAFACVLLVMGLNVIFFLILKENNVFSMMIRYHIILLIVEAFYIILALFVASYQNFSQSCGDVLLGFTIFSIFIARFYAVIQFLCYLLVATKRTGNITNQLQMLGTRLSALKILAPVTWCWTGMTMEPYYLLSACFIGAILLITALSIYINRKYE